MIRDLSFFVFDRGVFSLDFVYGWMARGIFLNLFDEMRGMP